MANNKHTESIRADDLKVTWHALSSNDVIDRLQSSFESGLTSEEAARRLDKYGYNQLDEKPRPTFLQMVLAQLNDFIVILLLVAVVISAVLGDWIEAGAILTIVILNAVLGVIQENRAEAALAALKKLAAPEAQVIRDGHRVSVPAPQLVPGDVVLLEAGNFIPADVRLLEAVNLRVEEAALTGESVPVQKNAAAVFDGDVSLGDRKNSAFMGTTVNYGRGKAVVTSTGMNTQLGMIADMLQNVGEESTPLQQRLNHLGKMLAIAALIVCALVFVVGLLRADAVTWDLVREMFMIAVSLAIAAVPEGLPAVVTITLAMGMREMVTRHALIRKLASVETLGSATVICSDKTGTLTQNAMTVTRVWADGKEYEITGGGYSPEGELRLNGQKLDVNSVPALKYALWVGVLNNDASLEMVEVEGKPSYRIIGDPTEGSILVAAAKIGATATKLLTAYPRKDEIPFDSTRKRMVTVHAVEAPEADDISPFNEGDVHAWHTIAVKGAPDVVLNLCGRIMEADGTIHAMTDEDRSRVLAGNEALTSNALRVLGLAARNVAEKPESNDAAVLESDLCFLGMVGMIDPARPEVGPALEMAKGAGIRTIMITGDYPNTARAIAQDIGLLREGHQVLMGAALNDMTDEQLQEAVKITDVFARVSPEHKMRIVDALRANGEIVAMTGDGVNDAPAIKRADIGVAMGITGTDVAKETADMVLTDDNYASIVSAIEQGRIIYSNIRKFVYYLLSCNAGEILTIFLAMLFYRTSPLTALQLLTINLVTDGLPALALATEKGDPDVMQQQPRPPKEHIINKDRVIGIIIQTIAITGATLWAYNIGVNTDPEHKAFAETMAFATLALSELLPAFAMRSENYSLFKIGIFTNKWMNIGALTSMLVTLAIIYIPVLNVVFDTLPLGWIQWVEILPLCFIPFATAELFKLYTSRRKKA